MNYQVELSAKAAMALDALDDDACSRVIKRLDSPASNPLAPDLSIKLKDQAGLWRTRVGALRILFRLDRDAHRSTVVAIGRRDQICRRL